MDRLLFSVLVCSVPSRVKNFLPLLIRELDRQAQDMPVEILCLLDNKKSSVGKKRNDLLRLAMGEYVAFIDDDDWVEPDYVKSICEAIQMHKIAKVSSPDIIVFDAMVSVDGGAPKICKYDLSFSWKDFDDHFERPPQHITATKAWIAKQVPFPEISLGEDFQWGERLREKINTQYRLPKALYHYKFNSHYTETQKANS